MRPPSYYTSLVNSHNNRSASSNYRGANDSTSNQFRSTFAGPSNSTSAYVTRNHLPYVSQSMLVAHCITGAGSTTKPYASASSSAYSSRPSSTKQRQPLAYSSHQYSSPLSSASSSRAYLSPYYQSSRASTAGSSYRPSISSYYKPIRLRDRPLLTQISNQIKSGARYVSQQAASRRESRRLTGETSASEKSSIGEREVKQEEEENWSSDVARNISRNKYLIKFREIDKRPNAADAEPIRLSNRVEASENSDSQTVLEQKLTEKEAEVRENKMRIPISSSSNLLINNDGPVAEKAEQQDEVVSRDESRGEISKNSCDNKEGPEQAQVGGGPEKKVKEKRKIKIKLKNINQTNKRGSVVPAHDEQQTVGGSETGAPEAPVVPVQEPKSPTAKPKLKKLVKKSSKGEAKIKDSKENVAPSLESEVPIKKPVAKTKKSETAGEIVSTEPVLDEKLIERKLEQSGSRSKLERSGSNKKIRFREYNMADFNFLSVLGHGGWGFVILAELKEHDFCFAVKCIKKITIVEDDDFDSIMIERKVLTLGNINPFICKLFCTFETAGYLFFVMEYCAGGDLMFHVQKEGKFTEARCRFYAAEIICAIRFLHNRHIIYRDLKLDNILLDARGHIRLVDFGMCQCRTYREEMLPSNFCGTPEYISPEIIKGVPYNHSVDWWSFGVLLYEMAVGKMPFRGNDENELLWNVCYEQIHYPMFLTKELTTLLQLLLEREPAKRLGMATCKSGDIYDQPWFRGTDWKAMEELRVAPPFVPEVTSKRDVQNFDADFTQSTPELSPVDESTLKKIDQNIFQKFPYTNPNISIFD